MQKNPCMALHTHSALPQFPQSIFPLPHNIFPFPGSSPFPLYCSPPWNVPMTLGWLSIPIQLPHLLHSLLHLPHSIFPLHRPSPSPLYLPPRNALMTPVNLPSMHHDLQSVGETRRKQSRFIVSPAPCVCLLINSLFQVHCYHEENASFLAHVIVLALDRACACTFVLGLVLFFF